MQIEDRLKLCLIALESRFPEHVVEFDEAVISPPISGHKGWSSRDIITYYEQHAPEVLQADARLVVDPQKSEIYLVDQSENTPALLVYCQGKLPCRCHREEQ